MKNRKFNFGRVDFQVSLLTACMVFISALCIFYLCYDITYKDMIKGLNDRVYSIYNYLEINLDMSSFSDIKHRKDITLPIYAKTKTMLEQIKNTTGVMYLYTAKEDSDGSLIYVVDGLDYSANDFRFPGDIIEEEIQDDLKRALSGEQVLPKNIKETDWGKIFITYLPIHDNEKNIIGVVGIEFEAEHQYTTYKILVILIPIFALFLCFITVIISVFCFRRISNPSHQNMLNTDRATGVKNRNAFDVDMNNMNARKSFNNVGLIVSDLNNLKKVNDTLGHSTGDKYIELVAHGLKKCGSDGMISYRIGGDEFAVIVSDATDEKMGNFLTSVHALISYSQSEFTTAISLSASYAIFDPLLDKDLIDTYKRADNNMYKDKKAFHEKNDNLARII